MNSNLEKQLIEKYRPLFSHNGKPTLISNIDCPNGWFKLIDYTLQQLAGPEYCRLLVEKETVSALLDGTSEEDAINRISLLNRLRIIEDKLSNPITNGAPDPLYIEQIKEKFGELRIYTGAATDTVYSIIDQATKESRSTCEECGSADGRMIEIRSWMSTLCPQHAV